jgi:tetratricopeptide (TPR) repeat protein
MDVGRRRLKELSARKPVEAKSPAGQVVRKPNVLTLPETAKIGHLGEARELLNRKQYAPAWSSAAGAIARRPFHCEAWLMLAEIARAAGDPDLARACAAKSKKLAPDWKPARQFLNSLHGKTLRTPSWAILPETSAVPRLTVFLIVKNEERFLGRCLESVRGLAHQIVVVDTGSTDGTMEIAKKFNAEIHEFAWNDDFSAARNEALKYATGDWVLALDADEELMAEHRQTILEEMQAAGVMAYRLPIISKGREDEGCGYVPRLFRNAPGLFYVGRVHEQVFSSIEVRCRQWGLKNNLGRSVLLHHGYAKEVMESRDKIARNLRLLEMAIGELPDEPNLVMNLGLELIRSGQFEAGLEKYREAFRLMAAQPRDHVVPELRETLLTQLTTHLLAARDYAGVAELWEPFWAGAGLHGIETSRRGGGADAAVRGQTGPGRAVAGERGHHEGRAEPLSGALLVRAETGGSGGGGVCGGAGR